MVLDSVRQTAPILRLVDLMSHFGLKTRAQSVMLITLLAHLGPGCHTDGVSDQAEDGDGIARIVDPLGTGGVFVEGCNDSWNARAVCWSDCQSYDPLKARCSPICTSSPSPDCPPELTDPSGGAPGNLNPYEPDCSQTLMVCRDGQLWRTHASPDCAWPNEIIGTCQDSDLPAGGHGGVTQ